MPRERFKTLTEQMFYILLCLHQERRGVEILEMVRTLTADRVSIGSGTLYDLLEQFTAEGMIQEVRAEGRRRSYIITEKGRQMLDREYRRIRRGGRCWTGSTGASGPRPPTMSTCLERRSLYEHREADFGQCLLLRPGSHPAEAGTDGRPGLDDPKGGQSVLDLYENPPRRGSDSP